MQWGLCEGCGLQWSEDAQRFEVNHYESSKNHSEISMNREVRFLMEFSDKGLLSCCVPYRYLQLQLLLN